jgi:large repetitive protein
VVERVLAVVGLAGAVLIALAMTGTLQPPLPGAYAAQYCPTDQYGNQYGDCADDSTAPTISSILTPGPNANGWNNTNVTLIFNASDESGGSGVRSITCNLGGTTDGSTRGIVFTAATVNQTVTCTATDWAGNVSDPATRNVLIDKVRPSITLLSRLPAPDLYGWNNTDVTVVWSCSDAFSGVVSPTVTRTITTDGANQSAIGTCADLAGNTLNNAVVGISIDHTAVSPVGGPPNDNIANATVVSSLPFVDTTDTTTATRETHEPTCTSPPDDKTVWYRFTPTQSGLVRVSLSGNAPFLDVISVWRPGTFGLSFVSCRVGNPPSTFTAQQGVTYYVRIGGLSAAGEPAGTGPFTVGIDLVLPPSNDAFANAKPVGSLPFSDALDLTGATIEPGEPLHPNGSLSQLVRTAWYRFTPTQDETVVLGGTTALSGVSVMAVYTGSSLATLHQVIASTQLIPQGNINFLFPLVFQALGGTTYSIQAGSFVPPGGDGTSTIGLERPVVYLGQTPLANANGWNNTAVTLNWRCSSLFPFGTPTATQTLTFEGPNQSATGFCISPYGSASDTEGGVNIDETPPNAPTATADRAPDFVGDGGWYADVVTIGFTGNGDPNGAAGSGVDPGSIPASVTFTTEGSHAASGTVKDLAGNESAAGSLTVQVDSAAPDLSATFSNADGSVYVPGTWTNQAVTVTFHCTDDGSGVASASVPQTLSSEGANQSATGSCSDNVGHTTTQAFGGIDIDLTPPEGYLVFDPATQDLLLFGRDHGGSGIQSGPFAPVASGKGGQVRTYTVADGAGNTLVLIVQVKPSDGAIQAAVTSLRYNAGATVTAPFTALAYTWSLNKDGSFKQLEQDLQVGTGKSQQHVDAVYGGKQNSTSITSGGTTTTVPGLALLRVATSSGGLVIEF